MENIITTPYSALTIPVTTIVMIYVSMVLMIAVGAVAFLSFRRRGDYWGYAALVGLVVYMVGGYILQIATGFAIAKIKGDEYVEAHRQMVNVIQLVSGVLYEIISVYIGMYVVFRFNGKRNLSVDITSPIYLAIGYFIASLLLSNTLMYNFEYGLTAMSINRMGFDQAVTAMVENGVAEAEAIEALKGLCEQRAIVHLFDALTYIMKACIIFVSATCVYGVAKEKMRAAWMAFGFGMQLLIFVPAVLNEYVKLPDVISIILLFVILAIAMGGAILLIRKYMPDEIESLKRIREKKKNDDNNGGGFGSLFGGRKKEEPKKMPKIVMPKD